MGYPNETLYHYTEFLFDLSMAQQESSRDTENLPHTDKATQQQLTNEFQNVLRILVDPELQPLRSHITKLYNNFIDQLGDEKTDILKCINFRKDKENFMNKINSCNKMIEDENNLADNYKMELDKRQAETQQLKRKEADAQSLVAKYKLELTSLEREAEKLKEDIELRHESEENDLKKILEEHQKTKDELNTKLMSLRNQEDFSLQEISELQKVNTTYQQRINTLNESINDIQMREMREKSNKQKKKEELNHCKERKDEYKVRKQELEERIAKLEADIIESAERLKKEKKDKDEQMRVKVRLLKEKESLEREHNRKEEEVDKQKQLNEDKKADIEGLQQQYEVVMQQKVEAEKLKTHSSHKVNEIITETEDVFRRKEEIFADYENEKQALERLKSEREKKKNEVNDLLSKRLQNDKVFKLRKNDEHEMSQVIIEQLNKMKKVSNEVASYKAESEKLARIVDQLKREQQKYGIQASGAHLKYYHTIEELKIKNVQIQTLQKKNEEVESKCKHQQNLYETVRSDRNLYCKQFLKSKDQINDLTNKHNRMTAEVSQLREQIKNKDQDLVEHDKEFRKIETENLKIQADQIRAKTQTQSTEEVIRNQENHIGHLKKIIQQAKGQKVRQQKDYDMVVNERDILGTQLIKKNQELDVLYEKIKLSNSNLTKADLHERKLQKEFKDKEKELAQLRNELAATEDQIKCIEDLKAEVSYKEKELLNERTKVRALEDELANPMNVHRWRKLEATDQQNYERILKIQTLQRRLISKTEEVQSKEALIRQKEKLFLELKNILSRQDGAEIHEKLATYRESLKEKSSQMKKMKNELEESHNEVNSLVYEVNRLKGEMSSLKRQYFELRSASEKEVFQERDLAKEMINLNNQERESNNMGGLGIGMDFPRA